MLAESVDGHGAGGEAHFTGPSMRHDVDDVEFRTAVEFRADLRQRVPGPREQDRLDARPQARDEASKIGD